MSRARSREGEVCDVKSRRAHVCLSAGGSCSHRTGHPFAASGLDGRRRRLSLCSLPVPTQFGESLGSTGLLRSVGYRRDLAVCASMILLFCRQSLRCPGKALLCRDELAVLAIHSQQPSHHLAGHGQRHPVPVAPFDSPSDGSRPTSRSGVAPLSQLRPARA